MAFAGLSKTAKDEMATAFACMILADEGTVTEEGITKVLDASGITVEAYYPMLFANLLGKKSVMEIMMSGSGSGGGNAGAAGGGDAVEEVVEEKKEEESESEEEMGGMDMFGGDAGY